MAHGQESGHRGFESTADKTYSAFPWTEIQEESTDFVKDCVFLLLQMLVILKMAVNVQICSSA